MDWETVIFMKNFSVLEKSSFQMMIAPPCAIPAPIAGSWRIAMPRHYLNWK